MISKTITYENLDGEMVTDVFYFHLSQTEALELELGAEDRGGYTEHLRMIMREKNSAKIYESIKAILEMAVGVKADDGRRFLKTDEARSRLFDSAAFDTLVLDMLKDPKGMSDFFVGFLPKRLQEEVSKGDIQELDFSEEESSLETETSDDKPWITENREPTQKELTTMSSEDLRELFRKKSSGA